MIFKNFYLFLRGSFFFTFIFGLYYKTKYDFLEIDITYKCNLKCVDCNRSCGNAPSEESMLVEQIRRFVKESIEKRKKWKGIRLLGGEPTMHDDLFNIIDLILKYKAFYPEVSLRFATNGLSEKTKEVLNRIPKDFVIENTDKGNKKNSFVCFNNAPIDSSLYQAMDFSNACYITQVCGLGLTKYGYYHCAIAGSIDRVFGFNLGRKEIPAIGDKMIKEKRILCKYCGHFRELFEGEKSRKVGIISCSWVKAYEEYRSSRKNDLDCY